MQKNLLNQLKKQEIYNFKEGKNLNRTLAQELANIMINYETITKFIAEKISDKMNESEKAIYVKLVDEYEILIFNRLKNFVENFSADDMGE